MRLDSVFLWPLAALATLSAAAPDKILYTPHVLEPQMNARWPKGSTQSVVWVVAGQSDLVEESKASIYLRPARETSNRNPKPDHPVVIEFDIMGANGRYDIEVPRNVLAGSYHLILVNGRVAAESPAFNVVESS